MFEKIRTRTSEFIASNQKTIVFYSGVMIGSVATGISFYIVINHGSSTYLIISKAEVKEIIEKGTFGFFKGSKGEFIVTSFKGLGELREIIVDETLAGVAKTA